MDGIRCSIFVFGCGYPGKADMKETQKRKTGNVLKKLILMWILPVFLVCLWQYASSNGTLNPSVLPGPAKIWEAFLKLVESGALWKHIVVSFQRVIKGYLIGAAAGLIVGTIAALVPVINDLIEIPIGLLRPVPAIALIPFFILWMGIGEASKVAVIVFGTFWPVLLNTMQGIKGASPKLLEVGRILEKDRWTILTRIILPAALPSIFTGLRLGVSNAWTCVVAAEMIAASAGVGFLIMYSREMAQPASLFVGIVVIGVLGLVLDQLLRAINRKLIYWD